MSKKKIIMIVLLIIFAFGLGIAFVKISDKSVKASESSQTSKSDLSDKIDLVITDNFFIEQTNEVYLNLKDYIGKTIKMEGFIYTYINEDGETRICCC